MRYLVVLALLSTAWSQTIQCRTVSGQTTCYDPNSAYGAGYNMGYGAAGIGMALAQSRQIKRDANFCFKNPDQAIHGTPCSDRMNAVMARWVSQHEKFHQSPENAKVMADYMEANNLNPFRYGSYDKAFKALKKSGKVELNS